MRLHRVKRFEQQEKQTNRVREITCQLLVGKSIYKQRKILSSKPHRENTGKWVEHKFLKQNSWNYRGNYSKMSLIIKEMQKEIALRFILISVRMTNERENKQTK